ncbi:MAG TPA: WecB/TagA/CpsF family glycosyltransferase [Puia sp.]|nr:WecB/TagA/CpsF family glycosyltransferase [Puia sp.]
MLPPERYNYMGVEINATNLQETVDYLLRYNYEKVNYVLFPDSAVVAHVQKDETLRKILNQSLLTLPDGLPSALYARHKGFKHVSTVSGFSLCHRLLNSGLSHYFLGSSADTVRKIKHNLEKEYPAAKILGYQSLPFYEVEYYKRGFLLEEEINEVNRLKPDLIWIGISSPKQDYLIHSNLSRFNHGVLLGVGAVFDYLSEDQKKSPEWVKQIGFRWLWRLLKEPKRLGPKYWTVIKFYLRMIWRKIVKAI